MASDQASFTGPERPPVLYLPWYARAAGWAADNVPAVATITGAFAYVGLRLAFVSFYRKFGVTPEDVGYDYGTVLTTTLPGMALLVLAFAVPLGVGLLLTAVAIRRRRFSTYTRVGWPLARSEYVLRRLLVLALLVLPVFAVSVMVWLSGNRLRDAANAAREGHVVEGVTVLGVPIFPWTVSPASITPITKDAQTFAQDVKGACVMYLGATNGAYVLYDLDRRITLRLPVAAIRVSIGDFSDQRCPPP
jgi:hypothetical protein